MVSPNPSHQTVQPPAAILFDVGRVLLNYDHKIACRKLAEYSSRTSDEIYTLVPHGKILVDFEEGRITPREFYREVANLIGLQGLSYPEFIEIWRDIYRPVPGMTEVLGAIRLGIALFIISNVDEIHWEGSFRLAPLPQFFSQPRQWILSFEIGAKKPAEQIFRVAIERIGADAASILSVDDRREYLDAFHQLTGGRGRTIRYSCKHEAPAVLAERLRAEGAIG